jgi:putative transposase
MILFDFEKLYGYSIRGCTKKKGFKVLPWRWIVERTFAWLVRYLRLTIDYKVLPETAEAFIYAAIVRIMVRRLA